MNIDDTRKRVSAVHYWVAGILVAVCIWDIFVLKVSDWPFYYPFKLFTIFTYAGVGFFVKNKKLTPQNGFFISCSVFYLYSYIGTRYLHPTYIFSFYEGLTLIGFIYTGSASRYFGISAVGIALALLALGQMPEPAFVAPGHSVIGDMQLITIIYGVLSLVLYWFFNRQRELIYVMDYKFASIGRQSAFLLHELKNPLSRFMSGRAENENRDAEYIYSIVEGVELLVTQRENLSFIKLNWEEIRSYLEAEFREVCKQYNIQLQITGFTGEGNGHKSTVKLALKNLVKNAIEAIVIAGTEGIIRINCENDILEVSNNGSVIEADKIDQMFAPFYTQKKTKSNFGIGLHFVDSVVKAHNGIISVKVENGWNIFQIKLGNSLES